MWRLRCVTFSSTSRLIPLFNLFSSPVCVRVVTHHFLQLPFPSADDVAHPYGRTIPTTFADERANASPLLQYFLFSFFLSPFLSSFPRPVSTFRPMFLYLYSLFARFLDASFSFTIHPFPLPHRDPLLSLSSASLESLSFSILGSTIHVSRATVLGGFPLSTAHPCAGLCAIQGGLQGRGIKQTP